MDPEKRALPLIEKIYAAALDPIEWTDFAKLLSAELSGAAVAVSMQLPDQPPQQIYRVGIADEFIPILEDLLAKSKIATRFQSRFALLSDLLPNEDLSQREFAQAFCVPQHLDPDSLAHTVALGEDSPMSGVGIHRRLESPHFTPQDFALCDLLVPHLGRSLAIHLRLRGARHERVALTEVIDRMPTGVILIDKNRQPVITNRAADRIIGLNDGFRFDRDGPRAATSRDQTHLKKLIDSVVSPQPGRELSAGGFMAITRPSDRRPYPMMATPLLGTTTGDQSQDAVAIIFISDPDWRQISTAEVLQNLYTLTHAEAELVRLLSEGLSLEAAAEERGVTMNTARSQLKHVFAKTETNRQGELVQMVLTGVAGISEE
jgi:DNA-binding CsgD family transcriptional regulator